ncbi:Dihydrolipoyllysine-residue acetyltransferase component of pyruvate dehydrogenase complex [Candidatus Xiphinematobacter sp. Idaho Grape]|uniref:dihydrolipoamide acetyltransferase family protein n=1 Tax=Candidatus Xiphinematobacter sp. Idaho Grape TaxID=1704307 RepID=UPI000705BDE9|nr:dihydrolipoamide acetyltransferase family protein [Candidatus Xiphinematobacter sp. Idaho Grape]ALJ56314.1 Dihydrolipoyllysine-residue acetyltransferase component of pyruvate dehydrogenase complex [Candidatus Xiphinematobacter sp. Idaho Grape]
MSSIPIEMPKLSDTMTEGTLLHWLREEGDKIEIGDVLAEIETDKAIMEMEAFDEGVLEKILVPDGTKVPVGAPIARLSGKTSATSHAARSAAALHTPTIVASSLLATPSSLSSKSYRRVMASPLAKKIAAELGVDLSQLQGTGPGGRIVSRDVKTIAVSWSRGSSSSATSPHIPVLSRRIELSGMRRSIASRLLESKTKIPHFYLQLEVDAAPLTRLRKQLSEDMQATNNQKITVNDFVLLAVARAATSYPKINATFTGDAILQYETVHLAIAVAVEDGVVTPVVRNAQNLSLREISLAVRDLAIRARGKKLRLEEYQGGTITVSNLGVYGIESFSAIINPPQAAILAVGAIVKKPVVTSEGQIIVGQRMSLSLSCDHRIIDGVAAAEFLTASRKFLEIPESLLFL